MKAGTCPFHTTKANIGAFDMVDAEARSNPFPYYHWLSEKDERRVYKIPHEEGFYAVHRYEDVKWVLQNPALFSNEILPTRKSPFFALMDGDEHARIRNVAAKIFLVKDDQLEKQILKSISSYTDDLIHTKKGELFEKWATPIPISTLCHIFDLDDSPEQIKSFHNTAIAINRALFVLGGTGPRGKDNPSFSQKLKIAYRTVKHLSTYQQLKKQVGRDGMREFKQMFRPRATNDPMPRPDYNSLPAAIGPLFKLILLFAEKLNAPSDTRAIKILQEAIRNQSLTKMEACMVGAFVMFAGYETTTSLLSNCVYHLAINKETLRNLKERPQQLEGFVQEMTRVYTPVHRFLRRTTEDVTIDGHTIPKGAVVIILLGAANTDASAFKAPFELDTERNAKHLSYGKGVHYCLGATLANFQVTEALRSLLLGVNHIEILQKDALKMVTDRDNGIFRFEQLKIQLS